MWRSFDRDFNDIMAIDLWKDGRRFTWSGHIPVTGLFGAEHLECTMPANFRMRRTSCTNALESSFPLAGGTIRPIKSGGE